jgi:hypothetical protein
MPYLTILIIGCFGAFYYRAAQFENESTLIWCGLSLSISVLTIFWLHWGLLGMISGQIGLFAGITIFRMLRKS